MNKQNEEKFQKGMSKLLKKYQMTKDKVIEFAGENPSMLYYTEDSLKLVLLGIIKLAIKLKDETCIKKTVKKKA